MRSNINSTFQKYSRTIASSLNKLKIWSITGNISFLKLWGSFLIVSHHIVTLTKKKRSRYYRGLAFGTFGFCTKWAICPKGINAEWLEVVYEDLKLRNLPKTFEQMRIVQASDFHFSRTVSGNYLKHCIQRINSLEPDVIVLTGDYITHDMYGRFGRKIAHLLSRLHAPHGVYATLGNHDYGRGGGISVERNFSLDDMIDSFQAAGIHVLRNEADYLEKDEHKLWFVGLGDLWAGDFEPAKAFGQVNSEGPVITLAHNPESVEHIGEYDFDAMVCGHTHGGRFEWTTMADRPLVNRRQFSSGMYTVHERPMYVNRGLGRHGRLFNQRPEITVFTLCRE